MNSWKHSGADAETLEISSLGGTSVMTISDYGMGFDLSRS